MSTDINHEKINKLRESIESGTYQVPSSDLAAKIIESVLASTRDRRELMAALSRKKLSRSATGNVDR